MGHEEGLGGEEERVAAIGRRKRKCAVQELPGAVDPHLREAGKAACLQCVHVPVQVGRP